MALSFSPSCANAMLLGLKNHIIAVNEKILLRVYAGAMPADPSVNLSTTNTLLASFEMGDTFGENPTNKTLTALPFPASTAAAAGTATFFRLGHLSVALVQGTASDAGGTGDLKLNKSALTQGEAVRVMEVKFILP